MDYLHLEYRKSVEPSVYNKIPFLKSWEGLIYTYTDPTTNPRSKAPKVLSMLGTSVIAIDVG